MRRYLKASHMCAIAQDLCCVRLEVSARENVTGSKFDLLFEVIFKDLAVPAVSVKIALGSWFVLAVAMPFY